MTEPRTLSEKVWDGHVVHAGGTLSSDMIGVGQRCAITNSSCLVPFTLACTNPCTPGAMWHSVQATPAWFET